MEGIVPLLDRQSEDGFQGGKLENNHIEHWIGAAVLNSQDGPWNKLLAHGPQSEIGEGIRISFESMSYFNSNQEYDSDNNILDPGLFHNVTAFTGFTADGKFKRGSITKRIPTEIEKGEKLYLVAKFKKRFQQITTTIWNGLHGSTTTTLTNNS